MGGSIAQAWREWAAALRGLSTNPLAHYLMVATRRRQRTHWLVKASFYFVLFAATFVVVYLFIYMTGAWFVAATRPALGELVGGIWLSATVGLLPPYALWALSGLFTAVGDSLAVLGSADGRRKPWLLDDVAGLSLLSEAEIVAALLRVLIAPLWPRVLGGAVYTWLVVLLAVAFDPGTLEVGAVLITAPLTVASMALSGVLASCGIVLFFLGLGRGLPVGIIGSVAGVLVVLCATVWLLIAFSFASSTLSEVSLSWEFVLALALPSIYVVLLVGWAVLGWRHAWLRAIAAVAGPLTGPLALLAVGVAGTLIVVRPDFLDSPWLGALAERASINFVWAWGVLAPLNPVAIPSMACWGELGVPIGGQGVIGPLRLAWLLALQLALIAVFAHFACVSVARWRRGEL